MINSDLKRKLSSQRATVSTTQSCRYYYSPKIKTINKELLQSSRSQVSISELQNSKSKVYLLFEKIKNQNIQHHKYEYNNFLKLDGEILEIYNDYQKNYESLKQSERIKTEVQNISLEYKKQNSQLIKTFDGLKLSDLDNQSINQIAISRYQFYYFRLRIQEKPAPIHIYLHLPESMSFLLFKLFLSTKIEFPTIFNADQIVQSNYAKLYSKNQRVSQFKEEFLYLTFYSHIDFVLKISIQFGQFKRKSPFMVPHSTSPQVLKFSTDHESSTTVFTPEKKKFIRIITQSKLTTLLSNIGNEFPAAIKDMRQLKIEQVQQSKRNQYEQRQLNIRSKLLVKEQLCQFRELERSIRQRKMHAQQLAKSWRIIIEFTKFIEQLISFLQQYRKKSKVIAKGKLIVWAIKTKTLISAKEYGYTPKERTLSKSSIIITMFTSQIKVNIKQRSYSILTSFLLQMKLAITILNQHEKTLKKITQIQRNYKALKQKKNSYRDKLWRLIKDNMNPILVELQRQQGKKQFYDNDDKPVLHFDVPCISQIMDEYHTQKKLIWYNYINNKFFEKDLKKKMQEFAVNLKEPELYGLPKQQELVQLIEKYGKLKKLL